MAEVLTVWFLVGAAGQYPEPRAGALRHVCAEGDASRLSQVALQLPWRERTDR